MKQFALLLTLLAAPALLAVDVEGYVYTVDGTPVAKAAITAAGQRTTTSDDGHFKLTAPADSIVSIDIRTTSFPPAKVLTLAGDPPLTITLGAIDRDETMMTTTAVPMRPGRAGSRDAVQADRDRVITGVVRLGKKVLANAPVVLHGMSEPIHATSDDKGRYRVTVAPGRYHVGMGDGLRPRLRPAGEARMPLDGEMYVADVTKAREASIDLELVATPMITGRVLDAGQKPVGRVEVMLVAAGRPALEFFHQPIIRTLPDGRFAIPAVHDASESAEVVATPLRSSSVRSKPFVLAQAKPVTITLPAYETVTVRVLDREQKPLDGANVGFAASDDLSNFGDAAVMLMSHTARRRVKTDASGQAVLHLETGDYDFAASAPRHQQKLSSHTIARPTRFDIPLDAAFQLKGRVRRGKQPVPGVHVTLRGGNAPRGERAVTTDAKGEFVFDALPRDTFTVGFFKGEEMIDKMLTVETPADLDVELPAVALLRGRVIDGQTGKPVAQFLYSLEPVDQERDERRMRGGQQRGESRDDGTFETTVPVGAYRIVAAATGFIASEPRDVRVVEGEPAFVEIALSRGATVSGRITDEQGKPLLEAQVMVMREIGEISRSSRSVTRMGPAAATTGDDGTFNITGVETGPAQLIVRRAGYVMDRRTIEVEPETRVDVRLARGLSISGIVTLHGKPIAGVSVDAVTSAMGADHQTAATDARGRFTLEGLLPARYAINANFEMHHAQLKDFDVTRQRDVVIELEGPGKGVIFGTVSGLPSGGKTTRGTVFAQATERGAEGTLDASGNYRIENAPAGALDIVAHVETQSGSRSTTRKRVELTAGEALRVDLDLTPALIVSGRVTHGASKPIGRAQIVFSSEKAGMVSAMTRDDGTYEVGLPAPGRYQIFANAEEVMSRHYQTVRDIRGSETFDIHIAEQSIEGIVLDAGSGQPIRGAMVTLVPREAMQSEIPAVSAETMTDAGGRFTMIAGASGPHLLIASANGYAQRSQELTAGGGTPVRAQFELAPAGELRVRVIDARNATPLEAHLVLADEKGLFLPMRPRRTPDGTETIFSLAPGRYRVKVQSMGYREKTVEVTAPGAIVISME